jgi:transposase
MAGRTQISDFKKGQILALSGGNISNREIARQLDISEKSVRYNLQKYREHGNMKNKARSGRPKVMTPEQERNLVVRCKRSPHKPATQLRYDIVHAAGIAPSISVVRKCLAKNNLSAYNTSRLERNLGEHILIGMMLNRVKFSGLMRADFVCSSQTAKGTCDGH